MKISIIVPAYNEEKRIGKTLLKIDRFFSAKELEYEILVIDDGSSDKTDSVVRGLAIKAIQVLSYGHNKGKGYAVNFGARAASGDWILFTDADNSTPIEEFDQLWEFRQNPVIIGSRYLRGSEIVVSQSWLRILLSRIGNVLVRVLLLPGVRDTQCGFKLFSAEAAKIIFPRQTIWGWGFDMEILRIAREHKLAIKEVPVEWRNDEASHVQSSKVFWRTFLELLTIRRNSLNGRYR